MQSAPQPTSVRGCLKWGTAAWFCCVLLYCLSKPWLMSWLALIGGITILSKAAVVGFGILICLGWLLALGDRKKVIPSLGMLAASAGTLYLVTFTRMAFCLGIYACFLWKLPHYHQVVERVIAAGGAVDPSDKQAENYIVDEGPPIRVAFVWDGLMDNWYGVAYDSTEVLLRASNFQRGMNDWGNSEFDAAMGLFGGQLVQAIHLMGNWYFCFFT
jgi:hypothetical protein